MDDTKPKMSMVKALGVYTIDRVAQRLDSWQNAMTGFGTTRDKTTYGVNLREPPLSDELISSLYHSDDMAARMVDIVPDEMLREGFTIETGDYDRDSRIASKLDDIGAAGKLADAIRWGRAYGGAALLLGCDDGKPADTLLQAERAKDLAYLYVIDRRMLWPIQYYSDPGHPRIGEPSHFVVTTTDGQSSHSAVVHESRLVIFRGAKTGMRERQQLQSWDLSILQRPHDVLRSFNTGWKAVEMLLTDGNQAIFKMTGLADVIAAGGLEPLQKRLQIMEMYRSVMRALVIDADSSESFERNNVSFADIPATLDKLMLRLSAAAQIPATILMGQSPAGMNATGVSDFRWFYDRMRAEQTATLAPRIRRIVDVWLQTQLGRAASKKKAEHISVKFPPLWKETPLDEATRRKTIAEADAVYIAAQVLMPDEVAVARFRPEGFATEIMLSEEATAARAAALTGDLDRLLKGSADSGEGGLELTPSDVATITKVNEARRSVGLPGLPAPDGEMTLPEFKAKYATVIAEGAAAEAGTAQGVTPPPPKGL